MGVLVLRYLYLSALMYGDQDHELHTVSALRFCTRSRLRFSSSKIAPALNITEAHEKILYCLREGSVVRSRWRILGLNSWDVEPAVIGS